MTAWLNIIGVTEDGVAALPSSHRSVLDNAETVIGVQRRLTGLDAGRQTLIEWDGKLDEMVARILCFRSTHTVLLASGDPNWFGIGATLSRHLEQHEFALHPVPSSFQLAASRLHWPMQNLTTLSLHGRPTSALHPHVLPGNRVLALTSDRKTLTEVAEILEQRGYGDSGFTVLENLGSADERISSFSASDATSQSIGDFYVLAIDCVADADAAMLPPIPGLPDHAFVSDGQLTKRDIRAATLAKLAPFPGALLWDVGAGSGSVAIEWMRAARVAGAIAFEKKLSRVEMIKANMVALGTPTLEVREGDALENLGDAPAPDAIFIGGDVSNEPLFEACWTALKSRGRLVANSVTLDGEKALFDRQEKFGGELARLEISVLDRIGDERVFRPRMAVTQWAVTKGSKS